MLAQSRCRPAGHRAGHLHTDKHTDENARPVTLFNSTRAQVAILPDLVTAALR